jgi:hypothetical protein
MKSFFLFFIGSILLLPAHATGDKPEYAFFKIPNALLNHANAVKRIEEVKFEIKSLTKTTLYRKFAITVLNKNGEDFIDLVEYQDEFQEIDYIDGALYDAMGTRLKTVKKKDIGNFSATGNDLASDNRVKTHRFYYTTYPYTIEYEIKTELSTTMFFPRWSPIEGGNFAVEKSSFTVVSDIDYQVRYKALNLTAAPTTSEANGKRTITWQLDNFASLQGEPFAPSVSQILPAVIIAPSNFEMAGYKGNLDSWQNFGLFLNQLIANRDVLPDNVKQKVKELVANKTNFNDKVSALYNYLQQNSHYISIQLGIGGFQPFDANFVATKKYGDCKALSNFMKALLTEAGIKSHYCIVKAGKGEQRKFLPDFPSNQFNHVITCAVEGKDTLWLECTSQTEVMGYNGSFTNNRYALLLDADGGKLVKTPNYNFKDNVLQRNITADLDDEGNVALHCNNYYSANEQDKLYHYLNDASKTDLQEYLNTSFSLPNYMVGNYEHSFTKTKKPSIHQKIELTNAKYAQVTGKRLFILPNFLAYATKLTKDSARVYDVDVTEGYTHIDSTQINVPINYAVEALPKEIHLKTLFGNFDCVTKFENNAIRYYRKLEIFDARFKVSMYNEMVEFYDAIQKTDKSKVVLVKKEN